MPRRNQVILPLSTGRSDSRPVRGAFCIGIVCAAAEENAFFDRDSVVVNFFFLGFDFHCEDGDGRGQKLFLREWLLGNPARKARTQPASMVGKAIM